MKKSYSCLHSFNSSLIPYPLFGLLFHSGSSIPADIRYHDGLALTVDCWHYSFFFLRSRVLILLLNCFRFWLMLRSFLQMPNDSWLCSHLKVRHFQNCWCSVSGSDQTPGDREGQGSLVCGGAWGCKVRDPWGTEQQQALGSFVSFLWYFKHCWHLDGGCSESGGCFG